MNPDAVSFHGLRYASFRARQVRRHNATYHMFEDTPALRIPADLEGVAP